jgi:hypothetical protein
VTRLRSGVPNIVATATYYAKNETSAEVAFVVVDSFQGRWSPRFGELPVGSVSTMWESAAPAMEEETLLPVVLGALEVAAAPPEMKARVEQKVNRRTTRILQEGIAPSPNGSIGRKLAKLRRRLEKHRAAPSKPARAG